MMHPTSLFLDDETLQAARDLALHYDCSTSEAVRRAVIDHWDAVLGVSVAIRHKRVRILGHLFDLFEGHDADAEIRRLKGEDGGF